MQPSGAPTQLSGLRCLLHALAHCLCIQTGQRDPSIKVVAGLCQDAPRRIRESGVPSVQILNRQREDRDPQPAHTFRVHY